MDFLTLRQLWSVVERTPASLILSLSDADLIHKLVGQLENQRRLTTEESSTVKVYIRSRTCLIRDLAEGRSCLT